MFQKFNNLGLDETIPRLIRPRRLHMWWPLGPTKRAILSTPSALVFEHYLFMAIGFILLPFANIGFVYFLVKGFTSGRLLQLELDTMVIYIGVACLTLLLNGGIILQLPATLYLLKNRKKWIEQQQVMAHQPENQNNSMSQGV